MKVLLLVITELIIILLGEGALLSKRRYYLEEEQISCNATTSCGEGACCRNPNGDVISWLSNERGDFGLLSSEGYCERTPGKAGTICKRGCGCEEGYTCYRRMTGVCCVPYRCYDSDWVRRQKAFWRNCKPPKCQFPV